MLLPTLLLHATLGNASACPPEICLESAIHPEPVPEVHGRRLRTMMRAFGRVRGKRPTLITTEGTPLSPSMSIAEIEQSLRANGSSPAFRVLYGRCALDRRSGQSCGRSPTEIDAYAHWQDRFG